MLFQCLYHCAYDFMTTLLDWPLLGSSELPCSRTHRKVREHLVSMQSLLTTLLLKPHYTTYYSHKLGALQSLVHFSSESSTLTT